MKTDDFNFDLPEELIAQFPPEKRGESRLLVLDRDTGKLTHSMVRNITDFVEPGTLMVFNNSKVRKARVYAEAEDTRSKLEFLLLKRRSDELWEVSVTKLKRQKIGRRYRFPEGVIAEVVGGDPESPPVPAPDAGQAGAAARSAAGFNPERDATRLLKFVPPIDEAYLDRVGHIPLPPYIKRDDEASDIERYQTVYAKEPGSAACPTAGLHFTDQILEGLDAHGVEREFITLHVGLGTFLPVRSENIEDHSMHEEEYTVSPEVAAAVNRAKAEGRTLLAVGTTSVRTLESAWVDLGLSGAAGAAAARARIEVAASGCSPARPCGSSAPAQPSDASAGAAPGAASAAGQDRNHLRFPYALLSAAEKSGPAYAAYVEAAAASAAARGGYLEAGHNATHIFIYPGIKYNVVDRLFTNFHTPKSTLIMLVSAFAGRDRIMAAYAEAVKQRYRFFSYGDAMLIR